MSNIKTRILALVAGMALVAMLGLAACGSSSSTSAASNAASGSASASSAVASGSSSNAVESASSESASASASTGDTVSLEALAKDLFQNCLVGQSGNVIYFYAQGEDDKTASLLVYDVTNDTFSVHSGKYEEPSVGKVKIDTKGAGEALEFKVIPNANLTAVDFTFDNGTTVTMGPVIDEDTEQLLQDLDKLIAKVNDSAEAQ